MPAKKKSLKNARRAVNPAMRQVEQLRKSVAVLKSKLERETRARKAEERIKSEAKKAGAQLSTQLKALRDHGKKLASDLKSALGDAKKREAARKEALAKIADLKAQYTKTSSGLRAELTQKSAELKRKSEELMKLAGQSAHRAAEIIRSEEHHAPAEAEKPAPMKTSYPESERSFPEHSEEGGHPEGHHHDDDDGTDEEHR
jgi:chromosome segregation ATPase